MLLLNVFGQNMKVYMQANNTILTVKHFSANLFDYTLSAEKFPAELPFRYALTEFMLLNNTKGNFYIYWIEIVCYMKNIYERCARLEQMFDLCTYIAYGYMQYLIIIFMHDRNFQFKSNNFKYDREKKVVKFKCVVLLCLNY